MASSQPLPQCHAVYPQEDEDKLEIPYGQNHAAISCNRRSHLTALQEGFNRLRRIICNMPYLRTSEPLLHGNLSKERTLQYAIVLIILLDKHRQELQESTNIEGKRRHPVGFSSYATSAKKRDGSPKGESFDEVHRGDGEAAAVCLLERNVSRDARNPDGQANLASGKESEGKWADENGPTLSRSPDGEDLMPHLGGSGTSSLSQEDSLRREYHDNKKWITFSHYSESTIAPYHLSSEQTIRSVTRKQSCSSESSHEEQSEEVCALEDTLYVTRSLPALAAFGTLPSMTTSSFHPITRNALLSTPVSDITVTPPSAPGNVNELCLQHVEHECKNSAIENLWRIPPQRAIEQTWFSDEDKEDLDTILARYLGM